MKKQIMTFILTVVMALGICGAVSAAEAGNVVGYVNVQQVFQSYPDIKTTMSAVDLERQKAQQEFESKAASCLSAEGIFIFGGLQVKVNNVRS